MICSCHVVGASKLWQTNVRHMDCSCIWCGCLTFSFVGAAEADQWSCKQTLGVVCATQTVAVHKQCQLCFAKQLQTCFRTFLCCQHVARLISLCSCKAVQTLLGHKFVAMCSKESSSIELKKDAILFAQRNHWLVVNWLSIGCQLVVNCDFVDSVDWL